MSDVIDDKNMIEGKNVESSVTSLVPAQNLEASEAELAPKKKSGARKGVSQNRRKSRELVLKAVYRGMLNQSVLASIFS